MLGMAQIHIEPRCTTGRPAKFAVPLGYFYFLFQAIPRRLAVLRFSYQNVPMSFFAYSQHRSTSVIVIRDKRPSGASECLQGEETYRNQL